jgi:AhpD family alkylhydroperoxidase
VQPRIDLRKTAPGAIQALLGLQNYVNTSSLPPTLLELVKIRASQINACAYCLDMHTKDARANGETEQRLYALNAWRETPFFNDRERAALAWTESLTLLHEGHVPDDAFAEVRQHFTEKEIVNLSLAIVAINSWNRLMVAFRAVPGHYRPAPRTNRTVAPD